ncbi:MAG: hypothetical protein JOY84_18145 [Curvibacter sp.]|nr:hypothetical protein [Curvibacter sp.]
MILTKDLRKVISERRKIYEWFDGRLVPSSIVLIRDMLKSIDDIHDRNDLLGELAGEYLRAELEDEYLLVERERLANHPDEAIMWIGLAHALSRRSDGAAEAKQSVIKGVEISREVGALIRYSLTCQAQIALEIGDPVLFGDALKDLILDSPNFREEDCWLDESLLRGLPDGFCDPNLLNDYKKALEKRRDDDALE